MDKDFLSYPDWQATADTLHLYLQMAGKVKLEHCYPEPEWGHIRMPLTVQGRHRHHSRTQKQFRNLFQPAPAPRGRSGRQ